MTSSPVLPLGSVPPNFRLKATDGNYYALNHFDTAKVLVIFFTCNQCPYVRGSDEVTRRTVEKYSDKRIDQVKRYYDAAGNLLGRYTDRNIAFVGINSNSVPEHPEESFEKMIERMQQHQFPWVYLADDKQDVALRYGALRTPHFFVFNHKRQLIYSGRAIDSPLDPSKMTVNDLENALDDFFQEKEVRTPLTEPIGCQIKWTSQHAPRIEEKEENQ